MAHLLASESEIRLANIAKFCMQRCNNSSFRSLKTDSEKIKRCCEIIKRNGLIPKNDVSVDAKKSEDKSSEIRQQGNQYFRAKGYLAALQVYNEALSFAPVGSPSIGIVYANRSAIYLDMGFYGFCLENIQLALDHNYPDHLKSKLLQRKKICLEKMKTEKDSIDDYKSGNKPLLSYPANPKVPFMIDDLKCVKNAKYGRHVVTNRNLKPGDIVLVEDSYVCVPFTNMLHHMCYNCAGHNFYNLKLYAKSTRVMFCSEKCATEAWTRYFQFQCPVIDELFHWIPNTLALRTTTKAFTMAKDSAELQGLINSVETKNAFNLDWNQVDERDKFRVAYNLCTNKEKFGKTHEISCLITCATTFHLIKDVPSVKALLATPEIENLFLELLLRFQMIVDQNSFEMNPTRLHGNKFYQSGSYALGLTQSLFNHSCAPNVQLLVVDNKSSIVVSRPIKAGQQLFLSYGGNNYQQKPLLERKQILKMAYYFDCNCQACTANWPQNSPSKGLLEPQKFIELSMFMDAKINEITLQTAQEYKDFTSEVLIRNDRHQPCAELYLIKKCLFAAVARLVPTKGLLELLVPKKT